jgi:hypothetical protein
VENNCTRQIADKVPLQIVMVKGVGSGLGALVVALVIGEKFASVEWIVATMLLGFVSYGLSIPTHSALLVRRAQVLITR